MDIHERFPDFDDAVPARERNAGVSAFVIITRDLKRTVNIEDHIISRALWSPSRRVRSPFVCRALPEAGTRSPTGSRALSRDRPCQSLDPGVQVRLDET